MQSFLTVDDCEGLSTLSYRWRRFILSQSSWDVHTLISQDDWALEWGESDWKEAKQKTLSTRERWCILKHHCNKNIMKRRKPYLRLCLLSQMQKAWLEALFLLKKPEAHPEAPRNKGVRFLLHLILFKKVSS